MFLGRVLFLVLLVLTFFANFIKFSFDEDCFNFLATVGVLLYEALGVIVFKAILVVIVGLGLGLIVLWLLLLLAVVLVFDKCFVEEEEDAVNIAVSSAVVGFSCPVATVGALRTTPTAGFFVGENLNELVEVVVREGVEGELNDLQLLDVGVTDV